MIRAAIVDDEKMVLDLLKAKVEKAAEELSIHLKIETFLNGQDMLRRHRENAFQMMFLDLEMPEQDGLSIATQLREDDKKTALIFITNRSDLVFQAFAYEVVGFVRKSHIDDELWITLERAYQKILSQMTSYLLKTEQGERIFPAESIYYIISKNHKVYLYDTSKKMTRIITTLEKLEGFLSPLAFVRCHSGIIVNCMHMHSIGSTSIELTNGESIPISRYRKKEVKRVFHQYLRSV